MENVGEARGRKIRIGRGRDGEGRDAKHKRYYCRESLIEIEKSTRG